MKKSTSDTHLLAANELENERLVFSLSQPSPNATFKAQVDHFYLSQLKESCVRRSSLLSIPSSFSFTDSPTETPIRVPIRATSTIVQTGQRRLLVSSNGTLCATPLVALFQPALRNNEDDLGDDLNFSTIVANETTLLLHDTSQPARFSQLNAQLHTQSSQPIADTSDEISRAIYSDDISLSRFEVLDKTINLHETSFAVDDEEFLTEPFWSESQVETLKNYQNF
jgi:hypothetical protein